MMDREIKLYLNTISQKNFISKDFIELLMDILYKKGIYDINESDLNTKLRYYYKNPRFRKLVKDVCMNQIEYKLSMQEKIYEDLLNDEVSRYEIFPYEDYLEKDQVVFMNKVIKELTEIYRAEGLSNKPLNIYGVNPNTNYFLVHGKYKMDILSWELVTDGDIKDVTYFNEYGCYPWEDPSNSNKLVSLEDGIVKKVTLKGASYAVLRGLENCNVERLKVYTNLTDLVSLRKICDIANGERQKEEELLLKSRPFVKKLALKV